MIEIIENTLLQQTFTYFAKYPLLAGVQKAFNRGTGNSGFSGYDAFKAAIDALDPNSELPTIEDYIFGVDEETIKKQIENVDGPYLFVDYGNITTDRDPVQKSESGDILIAVTVARPIKPQAMDMAETVLLGDEMLSLISTIKYQMRKDSTCKPFLKELTFPVEITPFFMREASNSIGWTMIFKKAGVRIV